MKDVCAFTFTRNEPVFLRIWCNYYTDYFPQEDIYIIDNSTSDGSVDVVKSLYPGINVISEPSEMIFDNVWLRQKLEFHQRSLLTKYNVALFSETDEILVHRDFNNIRDYCINFMNDATKNSLRAQGAAPVHQVDIEPDLIFEPGTLVLKDRSSMWLLLHYDKTYITKVPLHYCEGYHWDRLGPGGPKNISRPLEPGLSLIHLWQMDVNYFHERHMLRRLEKCKDGFHGCPDKELVKQFFRTLTYQWDSRTSPYKTQQKFDTPARWKNMLRY